MRSKNRIAPGSIQSLIQAGLLWFSSVSWLQWGNTFWSCSFSLVHVFWFPCFHILWDLISNLLPAMKIEQPLFVVSFILAPWTLSCTFVLLAVHYPDFLWLIPSTGGRRAEEEEPAVSGKSESAQQGGGGCLPRWLLWNHVPYPHSSVKAQQVLEMTAWTVSSRTGGSTSQHSSLLSREAIL